MIGILTLARATVKNQHRYCGNIDQVVRSNNDVLKVQEEINAYDLD